MTSSSTSCNTVTGGFDSGGPFAPPYTYTISVNDVNGFVSANRVYYFTCGVHCLFGMRGTIAVSGVCAGYVPLFTTTTTTPSNRTICCLLLPNLIALLLLLFLFVFLI
jgi:hypothetical protein